jgi:Spy/CpxP family protein refolding chaperone
MRRPTIAGTFITFGLLIGLAFPVASLAEPPGHRDGPPHHWDHHRGPGPERFIERHAKELGLGAETLEAIDEIVEESHDRWEALDEKLRDEYEALHELLSQEVPDESAVMSQVEVISALKLEAHKNRLRAMTAIRRLLTPEQRQELVRIREESLPWRKRGPMGRCGDDIAKLCPEAGPGRAALKCLSDNWDELSEECQAAFEGGRRRDFDRRPRFGPPGP